MNMRFKNLEKEVDKLDTQILTRQIAGNYAISAAVFLGLGQFVERHTVRERVGFSIVALAAAGIGYYCASSVKEKYALYHTCLDDKMSFPQAKRLNKIIKGKDDRPFLLDSYPDITYPPKYFKAKEIHGLFASQFKLENKKSDALIKILLAMDKKYKNNLKETSPETIQNWITQSLKEIAQLPIAHFKKLNEKQKKLLLQGMRVFEPNIKEDAYASWKTCLYDLHFQISEKTPAFKLTI